MLRTVTSPERRRSGSETESPSGYFYDDIFVEVRRLMAFRFTVWVE
jgi:hypothetical protein